MKQLAAIILMIFIAVFALDKVEAGKSATKSYRVSATIPAIAGFNVPIDNSVTANDTEQNQLSKALSKNQDVTIDRILRDNQSVLLKSITLK